MATQVKGATSESSTDSSESSKTVTCCWAALFSGSLVLLRILRHGPTRRALIVGCGLQMFQQLSGINTVMWVVRPSEGLSSKNIPTAHLSQTPPFGVFRYYSATILQMAGIRDDKQAIWLTAATSGTNFLFTLVGVWLVERVGRRKLTLGSLFGVLAGCCDGSLAWMTYAECAESESVTTFESCTTFEI